MEAVQSELDKMAQHQDRIDLIDSIRSENEESAFLSNEEIDND